MVEYQWVNQSTYRIYKCIEAYDFRKLGGSDGYNKNKSLFGCLYLLICEAHPIQ